MRGSERYRGAQKNTPKDRERRAGESELWARKERKREKEEKKERKNQRPVSSE